MHSLTNSAFIHLYVNEVADIMRKFNIECKHGGNITLFLPLWDNKLNTVRSRKYSRNNRTKCPFSFIVEKSGMVICFVIRDSAWAVVAF